MPEFTLANTSTETYEFEPSAALSPLHGPIEVTGDVAGLNEEH
jgi:hypothetical protein